jgi:GT2 family glycosyltransferase
VIPAELRGWGARRRLSPEERLLFESPLFDEEWYSRQVGRTLGRRAAVRHYLAVGVADGHHPHPLFDPDYVRSQWGPRRLRRLGAGDPLGLYLRREAFHTSTHVLFDTAGYVHRVPAAATHPGGPTTHYVEVGAAAGLRANDWLDGDLREWLAERRTTASALLAAPPKLPDVVPTPAADDSLVSVIVVAGGDAGGVAAAVESALSHGAEDGTRVECLVWDDGCRAEVGATLDALPVRFPQVRVVHAGVGLGRSRATNLALRQVAGATLVLLHDDVELAGDWLRSLVAPLAEPEVLGAQPVLLGKDLLIRSAGYAFPPRGLPHDLLRGFPLDDAHGVAGRPFAAVSGAALAVRRDQLLAVGGLDEDLDGEVAELDLCRRLAHQHGGHFQVVGDLTALHHERHPAGDAQATDRTRYLHRPDGGPAADDVAHWAAAGFRVVDRDIRGVDEELPPMLRTPQPLLVREARFHTGPRPLRWAIKNPTPAHSAAWGDIHFADGLADGLRALGQEVVLDRHETFERPTVRHDDVAVLIRGPVPARPTPEHLTLAWVISHPDTVTPEELRGYDAVFAASASWAGRRSAEWGIGIEPLLQATDPGRFGPDTAEPDTGEEVLFVGSTRGEFRPIVRDALTAGLAPALYGVGWEEFVPPERISGHYLDNTRVSAAYRSAGVVLNDHFEDMRREGFISNRIFDALASGARVVSDDVDGLTDVFGDAVRVYRSPADLRRAVEDRDSLFGDAAARTRLAEQVRQEHSFRARAEVLLAAAHRALAARDD